MVENNSIISFEPYYGFEWLLIIIFSAIYVI